ncbi:MAG: trypsin-like serine protease [Ruminococcaceae bacterium]|nr:trypsin-like serine protease [Oscillospiraceae bacterium]
MANDRDRENSFGGFQYRWNYDEYQKSLQRKRKKSAARGMRAFCLTTVFVFLLCTASLLVVLTASLLRGMIHSFPASAPTPQDAALSLPLADSEPQTSETPEPQQPQSPDAPTTEPLQENLLPEVPDNKNEATEDAPAPSLSQTEPAPAAPENVPAETEPVIMQSTFRDEFAPSDGKNLFAAMTISEIAEACSASTVTIQCRNTEYHSIGSGFFLTDDGYIVTNYHVIRRYDAYQVLLCDGSTYEAEFVSAEPTLDLALLKIDAQNLPVVTVGSSDDTAIGDQVVAIGTPGSVNFAGTVTYGYVSGLDRRVEITDLEDNVIGHMDMIQITAVINPGNSGGPLFNCFGEVIAINTMKLTGDGFEGMGFAIPITDVYATLTEKIDAHRTANAPQTEAAEEVLSPDNESAESDSIPTPDETEESTPETEEIFIDERPYAAFGVRCETVTEKEAQLYKLPIGVIIRYIDPASNAEQNGLRTGDMILTVNGTPILDVAALDAWAQNVRVGDTAEIVIFRAGTEMTLTVTFADAAASDTEAADTTLPDAA